VHGQVPGAETRANQEYKTSLNFQEKFSTVQAKIGSILDSQVTIYTGK
jgi:hypothetical protein